MRGAASSSPADFDVLIKGLFRFERGWERSSPLREFDRIVASHRTGQGNGAYAARLADAEEALRLLNRPRIATTPEFRGLVARLPAPPTEIALVWAALREEEERAPGNVEGKACQLILGELCVLCCRGARALRLWGLLPDHQDDSEGVVWASDIFQRIIDGCSCGGESCAWPALHLLSSWALQDTHARRGNSRYFALRSWLERACFGYSPAFGKIGAFSQGLVATIRPALIVGEAAVRYCLEPQCADEGKPSVVTKGRRCNRCDQEPSGAILFVRKIIDQRFWVLERFERCSSGNDEHFFTLAETECPECHVPSRRARSGHDVNQCVCGAQFPVQDGFCPVCGTRVPKRAGIVQAWVHRPLPTMQSLDPGDPRLEGGGPLAAGFPDGAEVRAERGVGFSQEACDLLNRLHAEGGMRARRVQEFVMQVGMTSRDGRVRSRKGELSRALAMEAQAALERLCLRVHTQDEEVLLRTELGRLLSG